MYSRSVWSRILVVVGSIAMLVGVLDPLEGSLVILPGSGLVMLGSAIDKGAHRHLRYWISVLVLIAVGVGAMFVLSALGGVGGSSGHSMWWALVIMPYPIGWLMGVVGVVHNVLVFFRARREQVVG